MNLKFWKRRPASPAPTEQPMPPVLVEVVRESGRSQLWRRSDGSLTCYCCYYCLATHEPCEFEELRKWPSWPNGTAGDAA